jgi:hypothetical protein
VEPGSPFGGERQPGQVPLNRTRHGLVPPPPPSQTRTWWLQASFPGNPWQENLDDSVPTHMEGMKGTSQMGIRYEA